MSGAALLLATRGSPLALAQVALVAEALAAAGADVEAAAVVVETRGDRDLSVPIDALAGQGVFTNDVDAAVGAGRAVASVHSLKDLPSSAEPDGLVIAAVLRRGEVRDCLVGATLGGLAPGAPIATGAPRRRAQIASMRPDLTFAPLRGNIGTRLDKVPDGGAAVVALTALERLGIAGRAAEVFSADEFTPQVGQGAIAIRCREDDTATRAMLAAIDDPETHRCVDAERAFLRRLGGGCDAAVGAHATIERDEIRLVAMIASEDGQIVLRRRGSGSDPDELGRTIAEELLERDGARMLAPDAG